MSRRFTRWSVNAIVGGLFIFLSSGCAVTGDGYGYGYDGGPSVGVGVDYYDSFGFEYGPWGPGYQVGPYRGGAQHPRRGGGTAPGHNYRPAPPSHSVPSIPSRPRPGGRKPSDGQHR